MRIRIFVCFNIFLLSFAIASITLAGRKGSVRTVITPYSDNFLADPNNIQHVRHVASLKRIAKLSDNSYCKHVFLYYGNNDDLNAKLCKNRPEFYIEGQNIESGNKERIHFSDIESIAITDSVSDCEVKVSVTVFPFISPNDLYNNWPSYSDLRERYIIRKKLLVETCGRKNGMRDGFDKNNKLWLSCSEINNSKINKLFNELPHYQNINLLFDEKDEDAPIWWAIDSVINDVDYPYDEEGKFTGGNMSSPIN